MFHLLRGAILDRTYGKHKNKYTMVFRYFYAQYLVLFTMIPRKYNILLYPDSPSELPQRGSTPRLRGAPVIELGRNSDDIRTSVVKNENQKHPSWPCELQLWTVAALHRQPRARKFRHAPYGEWASSGSQIRLARGFPAYSRSYHPTAHFARLALQQ